MSPADPSPAAPPPSAGPAASTRSTSSSQSTQSTQSTVPVGAAATVVVMLWALGTLVGEGVAQAGAGAAILLALVAWRRWRLAPDLRRWAAASLALTAWQALSPLLSVALGTAAQLPRASRWSQSLDTSAALALACVVALGAVPWRALGWTLCVGWLLQAAMGLFQFLVRWPFGSLGPLHLPLYRLHDNFGSPGGPERYAGMGFFFHRLRYAHGAVAVLGPAVAVAAWATVRRVRVAAVVLVVALIGCTYLSFARAALGAGLVVVLAAALAMLKGRGRAAAIASLALVALALVASPAWRHRLALVPEHLAGGDRSLAMGVGLQVAQKSPLLGVGFGEYKFLARPLNPRTDVTGDLLSIDAHNLLLTVWAETGLVGLALFLAQHLLLAAALWRRARAGSLVAAGALLSLLSFHVLGGVHYLPYHTGVMLAFSFAWGLGLAPDAPGLPPAAKPS